MSYMVIRIWAFDCDHPGCTFSEEAGDPYLPGAIKAMRHYGWTVTGRGRNAKHFCPKHKPQED